jgi:NAD(P)-dependent dehydrogenase (short-subunit alcohol dehydrogenase family)
MTTLPAPTSHELSSLSTKTIIITGAASGIGAATTTLAHGHGANVVIADITVQAGQALASSLGPRALFHQTDVTSWSSVLSLFETTYATFGAIDVVCANAGTNQWDDLLSDELDSSGALKEPSMRLMDVNLRGIMYVVKAAVHWFGKQSKQESGKGKSWHINMTGSAASFLDTPPLHLYCASKTGVLGLMRSLRTQLPRQNVSVNMVAPWLTVTPMLPKAIEDMWGDLPANTPAGVANALLLPAVREGVNGRSLFVAGNEIVDIEEKLGGCMGVWLGERLAGQVEEGQKRLIPGGEPAFKVVGKGEGK